MLTLALLPTMRHEGSALDVLVRARPVMDRLPREYQRQVIGAMAALSYSGLALSERHQLIRMVKDMRRIVGEEFFRDLERTEREEGRRKARREGCREGRREGRREAVLETARGAVLRVFAARFGAPPEAVRRSVDRCTEDGALASALCDAATAADAQTAAQAVLAGLATIPSEP